MNAKRLVVVALSVAAFSGCSGTPPFHAANPDKPPPPECESVVYPRFDEAARDYLTPHPKSHCDDLEKGNTDGRHVAECLAKVVDTPQTCTDVVGKCDERCEGQCAEQWKQCWATPSEKHQNYDLLFTEFDDAGWEADLRARPDTAVTEIDNVFNTLNELAGHQTLDVVVYTHGWHGSSLSDDYYVVLFRSLLESLADINKKQDQNRHVVGVYIGWRGNSWEQPWPAKYLTVWDRKLAAETVSAGAVQGLFARLRRFYLDNSCHPSGKRSLSGNAESCDNVHMLTIGHSYGALVNFRSLLGTMESGLNNTKHKHKHEPMNEEPVTRVSSFGDLVVLLNPAFEGTRYAPLFYSAVRREKFVGVGQLEGGEQLPVLITLQSAGDTATGTFFPLFRRVTTLAEDPKDKEKPQNIHALGWVPDFQTHYLCLDPERPSPNFKDGQARPASLCAINSNNANSKNVVLQPPDDCDKPSDGDSLTCRVDLWSGKNPDSPDAFSAFWNEKGPQNIYIGKGMTLSASNNSAIPNYFPYWDVKVDAAIMADHDDVWNPLTMQFILELYRAVAVQHHAQASDVKETATAEAKANTFQKE